MPMDKSRYPKNWDEIAMRVKEKAGWTCKQCKLKCLQPDSLVVLSKSDRAKLTLTVHHADYTPENNQPENLIALCSACHLGAHRGGRKNIIPGQLSLF